MKFSVTKRKSLQRMNSRASFRADDGSEESDLDVNANLTDVASKYGFKGCADSDKYTQSISPPTPSQSIRKCKSTTTLTQGNGWSDEEDRDTLGPPPPPSFRLKAKASKRALRESRELSQLSRSPSIVS